MSTQTEGANPARPLKICQVVPYDLAPEGGGVKQHAVHLQAALQRLGDEVTLVGPASRPLSGPFLKTFAGIVNVPGNGSNNALGLGVSPRALRRFFAQHAFDVIHVHEPQTPLLPYWATWLTRRTPHVATFHAYAEANGGRLPRRLAGAALFPLFQRGIAVSRAAARYAAVAWSRPLEIIPNGVPTRIFGGPEAAAARPAGPPRLLFVGRLADRRKGARVALRAFALLRATGSQATLDMVGDPTDFAPGPALPGLRLHGEVDLPTLARHYRSCDVFVAPSTGQESFGIVLLEAMAAGRPVVCSDIDGYREVAAPGGTRLTPAGDAEALAAALREVTALPATALAAMGESNRAHAQRFDWDGLAARVRAQYRAAIGGRAAAPSRPA